MTKSENQMLDKIINQLNQSEFDFNQFVHPRDTLKSRFSDWDDMYKRKNAIARVIQPKSIIEIGVRYGYSAIAFLNAASHCEYLGIDNNSDSHGGEKGSIFWAQKILKSYNAKFLITDSQKLSDFPLPSKGDKWDLAHIDGQQDPAGFYNDMKKAATVARHILIDGYFWNYDNFVGASNQFIFDIRKKIEFVIIIPGKQHTVTFPGQEVFAGDALIRLRS